jgi:hypothetical protein
MMVLIAPIEPDNTTSKKVRLNFACLTGDEVVVDIEER